MVSFLILGILGDSREQELRSLTGDITEMSSLLCSSIKNDKFPRILRNSQELSQFNRNYINYHENYHSLISVISSGVCQFWKKRKQWSSSPTITWWSWRWSFWKYTKMVDKREERVLTKNSRLFLFYRAFCLFVAMNWEVLEDRE